MKKEAIKVNVIASSETRGKLGGAGGNKSGKIVKRRRFTRKEGNVVQMAWVSTQATNYRLDKHVITRRLRDTQVRGEPITIKNFINFSIKMQKTKTLLPPSIIRTLSATETPANSGLSSFFDVSSVNVSVERIE